LRAVIQIDPTIISKSSHVTIYKKASRCFGGMLYHLSHNSKTTNCEMKFSVFVPDESIAD